MSFFGSLFGGSNPTLNKDMNQFGQIGGFATGVGMSDTTASSNFMQSLLSGDSSKIGQLLAPQISSMQKQGQQQKQGVAQFGNRSGGNNSSVQGVDDSTRADIGSMISSLTGGAASGLASQGSSLLGTGLQATGAQVDASQMQMKNWMDSFLGQGIGGAIGGAEGFGLGKLFPAAAAA